MHHSPSASLFSTEVQFPVIFARGPLSSHSDFFHFVVRASTFVYPYENEFLKVIASVLHSACCSLGEGVINGSSQSVCSRQALLLPLPPRTTHASLTPSQEQTNIWLHPASRNKNGKWWWGGGWGWKNEEISVAEAIERNCQTDWRNNAAIRNFPLEMKQSKGVYLYWT